MGRTLVLKLKTSTFQIFTRSKTHIQSFNDAETMIQLADQIWSANFGSQSLSYRLVGIQMTNLTEKSPKTAKKLKVYKYVCPLCGTKIKSAKHLEKHVNRSCPFVSKYYSKYREAFQ